MDKTLFSITCTTCRARLAVRSEEIIGTIVECPKCQSMVMVEPPQEWLDATRAAREAAEKAAAAAAVAAPDEPEVPPLPAKSTRLFAFAGRRWWAWTAMGTVALGLVAGLTWRLVKSPTGAALPQTPVAAPAAQVADAPVTPEEQKQKDEPAAANAEPATQSVAVQAAAVDAGAVPTTDKTTPASPEKASAVLEVAAANPDAGAKSTEPTAAAKPAVAQSTPPSPPDAKPPLAAQAETPPQKPAEPAAAATPASEKNAPAVVAEPTKEPAAEEAAVEIRKLSPPSVDVQARLADPVAGLALTDVPLGKAFDAVAALGALPVTLDLDAMQVLGVTPRAPVSLKLGATTIGDALNAIAAQHGLAVIVEGDQALVTTPDDYRETMFTRRYTVSDLLDKQTSIGDLANMLCKVVAPESWQTRGGRGAVEPDGNVLVIAQTGAVHQLIVDFCEELRLARQLPLRSRGDHARFTLTPRPAQAQKMLDHPVTANFHEPTPLRRVLDYLAQAAHCEICVDRMALAAADTCDQVEGVVVAQNKPLGVALRELLTPLGLVYRVIDARTLQVTTPEASAERLELAFYPPVKKAAGSGPALLAQLKKQVLPNTWNDEGGAGEVCLDVPSGYLLVLQSQPVQAALAEWLAKP